MTTPKFDPFGVRDNQADAYDRLRPRYTYKFINRLCSSLKKKESYCDIATGTGLLFFDVADKFSGTLVANDISEKQLNKAKEKAIKRDYDMSRTQFLQCDSF